MDLINRELAVISKAHSFHLGTPLVIPDIPYDFPTLVKEIGYPKFFQEVQKQNDNLVNKCVMEELWAVVTRGKALQHFDETALTSSLLRNNTSRHKRLDRKWMNEMELACFDAWKDIYRTKDWYKHYDPTYGSIEKFDAPLPSEVDNWWLEIEEAARGKGIVMNNKWNFSPSYHLDPNQGKDLQEDKLFARASVRMSEEEKMTAALGQLGIDEERA